MTERDRLQERSGPGPILVVDYETRAGLEAAGVVATRSGAWKCAFRVHNISRATPGFHFGNFGSTFHGVSTVARE